MKIKKIFLSFSFLFILFSLNIMLTFKKDNNISISERRELNKKPSITLKSIIDGKYFKLEENYILDQLPFRKKFKTIKSINEYYVMGKLDNHNIVIKNGHATKINYPLKEKSINLYIKKINYINENYLKEKNVKVYNTLIPDKNYYLLNDEMYPLINYDDLKNKIKSEINSQYIDIFDCLNVNSYYKTDSHWKQEKIIPVANRILNDMNMDINYTYEVSIGFQPFYGVYYGESSLPLKYEDIKYVTTKQIDNTIMYKINKKTNKFVQSDIYDESVISNEMKDTYDLFLGGANTIVLFNNFYSNSNKTLYIFSDSFGRSLAPLLLSNYQRIVLYDIRYTKTSSALEKVNIEDKSDILFAYSISSIDVSSNIQEY